MSSPHPTFPLANSGVLLMMDPHYAIPGIGLLAAGFAAMALSGRVQTGGRHFGPGWETIAQRACLLLGLSALVVGFGLLIIAIGAAHPPIPEVPAPRVSHELFGLPA